MSIKGQRVKVLDAFDQWHEAVAMSEIEETHRMTNGRRTKVHDFPVVWVRIGRGRSVPWPADDVRVVDGAQ